MHRQSWRVTLCAQGCAASQLARYSELRYHNFDVRTGISPLVAEISPRSEDFVEFILLPPSPLLPLSFRLCCSGIARSLWSSVIVNRDTCTDRPLARRGPLRLDIYDDCSAGHDIAVIAPLRRSIIFRIYRTGKCLYFKLPNYLHLIPIATNFTSHFMSAFFAPVF